MEFDFSLSSLSLKKVAMVLVVVYLLSWLLSKIFTIHLSEPTGILSAIGYKGDIPVEHFEVASAPLDYGIGQYSNLILQNPPNNAKLITNQGYVPQGTPLPLEIEATNSYPPFPVTSGPSVDGTKDTPNSMFMFSHNQCKPECCPATFSCSGGCVCSTKKQQDFIHSRGNGSTVPSEY